MRIAFEIDEMQEKKVKSLPRTINISEEMRKCLDKFLDKYGV